MFDKLVSTLEKECDKNQLLTSNEALCAYSLDATRLRSTPKAVFLPRNTYQIQQAVKLCNEYKIPVTARGSATGLSGGAVPSEGSLIISFTQMDEIASVDNENLLAVVEPGVITGRLQTEVLRSNLFYPPDPSSADVSTIGGNIAEGAGGPRALKYGVTRDYVMGLEIVLPDGSLINTGGQTYKNVSGYDLTRLFVASEGSLGLITKATLKLLPKPKESKSFMMFFRTVDAASKAVIEIIKSSVLPAAIEIMDKTTIEAVAKFTEIDLPQKTDALLLIEIDGYDVKEQEKILEKVFKKTRPILVKKANKASEVENIWKARKAALPALSRIAPSVLLEDATVKRTELPKLIKGIEKIAKKNNLVIGCFGHAADGNLHPTIVTDLRDENNAKNAKCAVDEIFNLALKLGGTLSGEHGIGLVKKGYFNLEHSENEVYLMKSIKKVFDKNCILNPEKTF